MAITKESTAIDFKYELQGKDEGENNIYALYSKSTLDPSSEWENNKIYFHLAEGLNPNDINLSITDSFYHDEEDVFSKINVGKKGFHLGVKDTSKTKITIDRESRLSTEKRVVLWAEDFEIRNREELTLGQTAAMLPKGHEKLSEEEFNEMMEQHYYELDMKAGDGSLGRIFVDKVSIKDNGTGSIYLPECLHDTPETKLSSLTWENSRGGAIYVADRAKSLEVSYNIIDCFVDRNFNGETQLGRLYLNNSSDKEAQDYKLKNTNFVFKYNPENTYNNYSLTIDAPSISLTGGRYYMPDTNSTNERVIKNDGHIEIKNINAFIEGSLEVNSNGNLLSIKNKNPEDKFIIQRDEEKDDPKQKVLTSIDTNGDVAINGKTTLVGVNSVYGKDGVALRNADIENSDVSTEQKGTFSIANTLVMNSYVEGVHSDSGAPTLCNFVSRNLDVKNISFINLTAQENDEKIISLTSEASNKKVSIENCLFDLAKENQHRIRFTDASDSKNESINNCTFNGKTKLEVKDANLSNSIFTNVKGSIENVPAGIYECDLKENIMIKNQKEKLENSSFENVKVSNVSDLSGVKVFNFEGKDSKYQESTTPEKKQDHGLAIGE